MNEGAEGIADKLMPESHKTELDRRFAKYQNRNGYLLSLKEPEERIGKKK